MEEEAEESSSTLRYTMQSQSLAPVIIREQRSKGLSFQVWPAASALCKYLEDEYPLGMRNVSVLELGSGPGLLGLVVARLGARVLLTDLPQALPNLIYNVEANFQTNNDEAPRAQALSWGIEQDVLQLADTSVDLILASDVVYYDYLFQPLLQTLSWLLLLNKSKSPTILLAHIRRWTKDAKFFKQARKLFDVEVVQTYPPPPDAKKQIVIYSLTAKQKKQQKRTKTI